MATDAKRIAAEVERLATMAEERFVKTLVHYVMGGTDPRCPRDVQGAAFLSPDLAPETLTGLETALRQAKAFNPKREDESKRDQQARIAPWRERIRAAMAPVQDVIDDQAHAYMKTLAALDDAALEERWRDYVLDEPAADGTPHRIVALGFRSPRVAARAQRICRIMTEDPIRFMHPAPAGESGNALAARIESFRERVTAESQFLRYAAQYAEARQGRMPAEPNHRLQALKLLGQAHPEELLVLLRQVRGEDRVAVQEARQERRDIRRAARTGGAP
ncbi:hypothetical protein ABTY59_31805 [Streptomyces sp. NPDC096079]|uniref:hypothetical protein n=1 Tax=Streptomyces sp. NPDC096079 TaxID=3155820 RepID=UPI00332053AD